ncbi:ComEC/Rec2 family competence protein [Marivita sp. GX14005]|uniref:ComEC/Rec2 family competence protein n=1 Tax=Marivita sp. GX14005 TaxID=2942276 RepID=UPI00201871E2|nr:ComEC/Rec2 family competence protein [Marivita sp. GX14005]MCL3883447.1 ComEC family competence protein [Marivita sp. GX14005]
MARVRQGIADIILRQRGALFGFVPVLLACGIGLYFSFRIEPPVWALWLSGAAGAALLLWYLVSRSAYAPLICALALVASGLALAGARAHWVAGPVLDWRYYGPVTGRIVAIDRSASDAVRITLDRVWLTDVAPARTPLRVRLSLHGKVPGIAPAPGMIVMTTAHLGPPGGAVEPGGFDFRRHAWFLRLGAVGYSRAPLMLWDRPEGGQWVFRIRMALSARVQAALPGKTGAFAAAIITGDRSAIPQDILTALRDTNLAHLLAISGLHMGLVSAFVFAALRLALLLGPVGLHWPVKKIAAAGALAVSAGYLALSGGNIATERAFIMVAVMLLGIMVDRRAISLRAVALAAVIVLVLRPEALMGPGFQMSFAATTGLVAVFGAIRDGPLRMPRNRILNGALSVALSSAVAGAATAPIAMVHFNQIAQFGLLANLATVPLMGILIIPAAVLAVLLMPFGLDMLGLWPMGLGLDWILHVADTVADWDGAVRPVMTPQPAVLPVIALGALWTVIWTGRARWLGALPVALAAALWITATRPDILIAEGGKLVGVMTPEGRALSRAKGSGFIARVWLENDGHGLDQARAAALWEAHGITDDIRHIHGKRAAAAFRDCGTARLIVASAALPVYGAEPRCRIIDKGRNTVFDSLSARREDSGEITLIRARDVSGARLWNDKAMRAARFPKATRKTQ